MNLKRAFTPDHDSDHILSIHPGTIEEALNFMTKPGKIDFSDLTFYAKPHNQEEEHEDEAESATSNKQNDYPDTLLEIAIFPLPPGCKNHNCVLSEVGIGRMEELEGLPYLNPCHKNGALVVDETAFKGQLLQINVPGRGNMKKHLKKKLDAELGARFYEVLIANCNKQGREVKMEGQIVFEISADDGDSDGFITQLSTSMDDFLPDTHFILVSIATFLFLVCCCFRVRCNPSNSSSSYDQAPQQDDVDIADSERV